MTTWCNASGAALSETEVKLYRNRSDIRVLGQLKLIKYRSPAFKRR